MPERPSQCPDCGSTKVRYDAQDGVAWCRRCGREFEPYQQSDEKLDLKLSDRLANALEVRWRALAEREGTTGGAVALTTLVDVVLERAAVQTLTFGRDRVGQQGSLEDQANLSAALAAEERYKTARELLQILARAGRVREIEPGVWRLETSS